MKRAVCAAALALIVGSSGYASADPGPRGPSCPLTSTHRQLVEEVVTELVADAVWVGSNAHGAERGFALSLVGVDTGHIGSFTRIGPCARAETFVPFCDRDFELPIVRCLLLECEAAGVDTVEASISGGKPKYKKRTTLEYDATAFAGTVVYDPFPEVVWRTVEVAPGSYSVSANVFRRPVVTPSGETSLDLTHSGSVSIKIVDGEITSLEVDLAFPTLVAGEPQIVVDISFDARAVGTGTIRRGDETLATISGKGANVVIAWSGDCGQ
jgi:hypothetical protein